MEEQNNKQSDDLIMKNYYSTTLYVELIETELIELNWLKYSREHQKDDKLTRE